MAAQAETGATTAPPDARRLAGAFKSFALDAVGRLLDATLDRADEGLRELTADAEYDPDRWQACEAAMRLVQEERARLTQVFIQVLGEGLSSPQGGVAAPDDEALLPPEEADEVVRAGRMAGRLAETCASEAEALEARLATLAEEAELSATAISPTAICQAFRQAMQTVNGPPAAKHLVYGLFENTLERHLGRLYQSLDTELAKRGVAARPRRQDTAVAERPPRSAHWARQLSASRRAVAPENEFGTGEILDVLAALADDNAVWDSPARFLEALLTGLRRRQRDTAPRALPAAARRQLALAVAWWCDLRADEDIPEPARPLLARLRPTLMEIALLDDGLFRDPDNPARRMVNELATLAPPGEAEVWRRAEAIVERVAVEFHGRPAVVTAAAKALARRRERGPGRMVWKARRMTTLELRQQALGRPPPTSVRPFLLKGWAPVLVQAFREADADGPTWYTAVSRLSRLLDLVQPPVYGADRENRVRAQRGLVREIRARLLERGVSRGRIAEFLAALEEVFAEANQSEPAVAPEIETFAEPVIWDADVTVFDDSGDYGADHVAATTERRAVEPIQPRVADWLLGEACRPGRWFQIYTGGERPSRWLRLLAYDPASGTVTFGDRRGRVLLEREAAAFAEDLRAGRSRPIYDAEAFEARLAAIIGEHSRSLPQD